ncbi:hypothetical protein EVAR_10375_1 [Eumeta japonica]|uniref:Uncharacterized protein n=1 Tax=Eumeta variegata TaxID=151549 RepID=A0A4C1UCI3_EUMVA|nr:hypothetical protein EVAR_10375_1 [Eumeta japonica]
MSQPERVAVVVVVVTRPLRSSRDTDNIIGIRVRPLSHSNTRVSISNFSAVPAAMIPGGTEGSFACNKKKYSIWNVPVDEFTLAMTLFLLALTHLDLILPQD